MSKIAVKTALLTSLLISLSACAEQQAPALTEASFVGQSLELKDQDGQCSLLKADGRTLPLQMKWPCQFSPNKNGELRVETQNDVPIFLVERSEPQPPPSRDCLTEVQAVRQINGALEASVVNPAASCLPRRWDQKMFTGLFSW